MQPRCTSSVWAKVSRGERARRGELGSDRPWCKAGGRQGKGSEGKGDFWCVQRRVENQNDGRRVRSTGYKGGTRWWGFSVIFGQEKCLKVSTLQYRITSTNIPSLGRIVQIPCSVLHVHVVHRSAHKVSSRLTSLPTWLVDCSPRMCCLLSFFLSLKHTPLYSELKTPVLYAEHRASIQMNKRPPACPPACAGLSPPFRPAYALQHIAMSISNQQKRKRVFVCMRLVGVTMCTVVVAISSIGIHFTAWRATALTTTAVIVALQ